MIPLLRKLVRSSLWILSLPLFASCSYTFYAPGCDYPLPGILFLKGKLHEALHETSGIETSGDTLLSFNDSGGAPSLFLFTDPDSILGESEIPGAVNVDWEDIASDGNYLYIADIGNNRGTRDTLTIYRVPAEPLREGNTSGMQVGTITFSYTDPVSHNPFGMYSHDCEAVFFHGDSLYLFTKNWVEQSTRVYVLPAREGHYDISPRMRYDVKALITGADIFPERQEVVLVGYSNYMPVLITYKYEESPALISCGGKARIYRRLYGRQTEGVCYDLKGNILVSAEKRLHPPALFISY